VSQERSFGLQWQLALICLVVGAGSALAALTAYLAGLHYGLAFSLALGGGFAAGLLVGRGSARCRSRQADLSLGGIGQNGTGGKRDK